MDVKNDKKVVDDLIYLTWCALHGSCPDEKRMAQMDMERVFKISKKNDLAPTIWLAVESFYGKNVPQMPLFKEWKMIKDRMVRKNILMDFERQNLYRWMDERHIWHMSLKGIELKQYYPKELRAMADNDILFDRKYQMEVCRWFEEHGYEPEAVGKSNHDVYLKDPIYNFEMHTSLYGNAHNPVWKDYYDNVKEKLIRVSDAAYEYTFDREDAYVYLLTHFYKHYYGAGTGLRSLVDIAVYRKQYKNLDREKIDGCCKLLGLSEFECMVSRLADELLVNEIPAKASDMEEEDAESLFYMIFAGTYGNQKIYIQNHLKKLQTEYDESGTKLKFRYLMGRLFPEYQMIREGYPRLGKYPVLKPFLYIYRLIKGPFKSAVWREFRAVRRSNGDR